VWRVATPCESEFKTERITKETFRSPQVIYTKNSIHKTGISIFYALSEGWRRAINLTCMLSTRM
jgi:hypothetical protein